MTEARAFPSNAQPRRAGRRLALPSWLIDVALVWLVCGAFLGLLGPIAPLMVMSGAALMLALRPEAIMDIVKAWPLLLIAALGPVSAAWSDLPAVSFRYGAQLAVTVAAVMIAAAVAGPSRYLRGLFLGTVVVLVLCILSGRQGQSQGGMVLVGLLGSKNAMGQLCMLVLCTAVTMVFSKDQPKLLRRAAIGAGLLGLIILVHTFATGAVLATLIFGVVFLLLLLASRLARSAKFLLALVAACALAPLWLIRGDLTRMYQWVLVEVLNKDVGLTGREYLWRHADALIQAKPVLGHGYRAIWLGDSAETIGLLRWAKLDSGIGFNFHNTFRDAVVDFGFVGAGVIFIVLGVGLARLMLRATRRPTNAALLFFAAVGVVTIIRSYAETTLGAFTDSMLIVVAISAFGYMAPRAPHAPPTPRRAARRLGPGRPDAAE